LVCCFLENRFPERQSPWNRQGSREHYRLIPAWVIPSRFRFPDLPLLSVVEEARYPTEHWTQEAAVAVRYPDLILPGVASCREERRYRVDYRSHCPPHFRVPEFFRGRCPVGFPELCRAAKVR
jgi:hypothetical protein